MPRYYPALATQPYTGTLVDKSPIVTNAMLPYVGGLTPQTLRTIAGTHGRRLAGFGDAAGPKYIMPPKPVVSDADPHDLKDEPDWHDKQLQMLEDDDDVVGSGVFDPGGPRGRETVNPDMGVFATNPSIPGFIARNPPYTLNYEVRDVVTGGPTVEVAGGGMFYIERDGRPAPTPTERTGGGYVQFHSDGSPVTPVPWSPPVNVVPQVLPVNANRAPALPPAGANIVMKSTVNVANVSKPISGFGIDDGTDQGTGSGKWLLSGLLVGAGIGFAWHMMKKGR